jgi:putative ABC transport system ATP-binding protein
MLRLIDVSKIHQVGEVQTTALAGINLEIEAGEYVAITGPSGCGKSTLLNVLGMLDIADQGQYWFDEQNIVGLSEFRINELRRGRIGFIFQNFNLIEELSVYENVELALAYTDYPPAERRARVETMLSKLGIEHRAGHRPSQLSGGQQQRVAIARALAAGPAVLLADEPTGNLDSAHGDEVMALLRAINAEGTTVIMVSHSPEYAAQAGRTVQLRDGKVIGDQRRAIA